MTGEMAELAGDAAETRAFWPAGSAGLPRVLPSAPVRDLRAHQGRYGVPGLRGTALIGEVERSGLTGRGGAAYPAGKKLRAVARAGGPARGGGDRQRHGVRAGQREGRRAARPGTAPGARRDRARGGGDLGPAAYLCVRRQAQADALAAAIAERGGYDPVPVQLALVPERYVSSAESSLVRYLNGGPALPGFTPPRPFERGVRGRPTLVSNVETLANLALISRHGADWFRSAGTAAAPGSALVTVSGAARHPGVYEIAFGTPVRDVLALAGGSGEIGGVQAVLAGGYFGSWLPGGAALGTPAAPATLRAAGASFGAGIFLVLPAAGCGLAETARVVRYLRAERRAVRPVPERPAGHRRRA